MRFSHQVHGGQFGVQQMTRTVEMTGLLSFVTWKPR